jgi:enolase-phosphatase E1
MNTRAVLLDIEGTTTPIDFVHKTLFPYARKGIGQYVANHFDALRPEIITLAEEHSHDRDYHLPFDPTEPGSVSGYLESLIDRDRKSTPLKSIQGKLWQVGYESGELVSRMFGDVMPAFGRWKDGGKTIAIYSSGSVLAQQLLFRHTEVGDLTPFISQFFDTNMGAKRESESYQKIAEEMRAEPSEILFVSDVVDELDAARSSGLQTLLSIRPGNAEIESDTSHRSITTFADI